MSERDELATWGTPRVPVICSACDWRYLALPDEIPDRCPHCAAEQLQPLEAGRAEFPYLAPPELLVPFIVSQVALGAPLTRFVDEIPLPPVDLKPATLARRLRRLYLPMWLVDSDVTARWQAEVGFDYEVVSHQERYADGAGWRTEEVRETRVRWEPRVGHMTRHYDNITAPALTRQEAIRTFLGEYDVRASEPYAPDLVGQALVRAPDREPASAWPEAELGLRQRAIAECQEAAGADHLRDFRWAPSFDNRAWTLLLLPVYATYYLDDEGAAQQVLINGQTGQLTGTRRGSLHRAHRRSLTIGIVALVLFILSLALALGGMLFPPLAVVGVVGALAALLIGVMAIIPTARVMLFNRRESQRPLRV